jgi:pimeloyl-ACP methyl ester carboxylesterase
MSQVFANRSVAVAGGTLRYAEAGAGETVVCIVDTGQTGPSQAHALIAARRRVVFFDMPRGEAPPAFARTIAAAVAALGIARCDVMGQGAGATAALWLALEREGAIDAVALVGPVALDGGGGKDLERRLGAMKRPVLALFGTKDAIAPPESGDRYRAALPDCNLMFVYEAGHDIAHDRPEALAFIALEFFERKDLFLVSRESGVTLP